MMAAQTNGFNMFQYLNLWDDIASDYTLAHTHFYAFKHTQTHIHAHTHDRTRDNTQSHAYIIVSIKWLVLSFKLDRVRGCFLEAAVNEASPTMLHIISHCPQRPTMPRPLLPPSA